MSLRKKTKQTLCFYCMVTAEGELAEEIIPGGETEIMRGPDEALAQPELPEPWGDTMERLRGKLALNANAC